MDKKIRLIPFFIISYLVTSIAQTANSPSNISVTQLDESTNRITWQDESVVTGETYNVYVSQSPITEVGIKGVVKIGRSITEGIQSFTHVCYTPSDMGTVNYYYAVTSVDPEGKENINVIAGQNATESSVAGKTIPVGQIALIDSPVIIDGNIDEFKAKAIPFVINGDRRVDGPAVWNWLEGAQNWMGNSDLSGNIYVMMDSKNMYFGFEVFDDKMVQNFSGFGTWNGDAPEVNIGLYHLNNLDERHQTNYQRGENPDYQFRLSIGDEVWMHVPWPGYANEGLPNHNISYAEIVTLPFISQNGYFMEVKIPFDSLAADPDMQNHPGGADSLFHPEDGMLIPIDFTLNDADDPAVNYEGNFYYYWGDTTSFRPFVSPKCWSWTIIGDFNTLTSIENNKQNYVLNQFDLKQNYPNPFNPSTTIHFNLKKYEKVNLSVYDVTGKLIDQLINDRLSAGEHAVKFSASNISSGVYFYVLIAGQQKMVRKMTLIK